MAAGGILMVDGCPVPSLLFSWYTKPSTIQWSQPNPFEHNWSRSTGHLFIRILSGTQIQEIDLGHTVHKQEYHILLDAWHSIFFLWNTNTSVRQQLEDSGDDSPRTRTSLSDLRVVHDVKHMMMTMFVFVWVLAWLADHDVWTYTSLAPCAVCPCSLDWRIYCLNLHLVPMLYWLLQNNGG